MKPVAKLVQTARSHCKTPKARADFDAVITAFHEREREAFISTVETVRLGRGVLFKEMRAVAKARRARP